MKKVLQWKTIKSLSLGLITLVLSIFLLSVIVGLIKWIGPQTSDFEYFIDILKYISVSISYILSGFVVTKFSEEVDIYYVGTAFFVFITGIDFSIMILGELNIISSTEPTNILRTFLYTFLKAVSIYIGIKFYIKRRQHST